MMFRPRSSSVFLSSSNALAAVVDAQPEYDRPVSHGCQPVNSSVLLTVNCDVRLTSPMSVSTWPNLLQTFTAYRGIDRRTLLTSPASKILTASPTSIFRCRRMNIWYWKGGGLSKEIKGCSHAAWSGAVRTSVSVNIVIVYSLICLCVRDCGVLRTGA